MDKIVETYDLTLRNKFSEKQQDIGEKEILNIIKALDDLGITYIDIGTPVGDPISESIYAQLKNFTPKNSILVPFVRAIDCEDRVSKNSAISRILELDPEAVCIEGECSDYIVREQNELRTEENIWRIEGIISWLKSRGKTVIFSAANFFDAFTSTGNAYAREVIKSAISAGADRIVLCDTNGFCLPHDIISAMGIISNMTKKIGICSSNSSGCAASHAISAVRNGATHIQGSFLGTGECGGNINIATAIVNLQLGMGYRCIQDLKINRITPTVEYVAEQMGFYSSPNTPYVGRDSFSREMLPIPNSRSDAITAEMIGNSIRTNMTSVNSSATVVDRLRALGYKVTREQIDALGVAQDGYISEASLVLRVLRAMGEIPQMYKITAARALDEVFEDLRYVKTIATLNVMIDGKEVLEAVEGNGTILAIWHALEKCLIPMYPCIRNLRITNLRSRVIVDNGKSRIVMDVTNGNQTWSVSATSSNMVICAVNAITDMVDYQLLLSGYRK